LSLGVKSCGSLAYNSACDRMSARGQGRRINCADGVSGSHLIAAYCCAARLTQGATSRNKKSSRSVMSA
jgi:hypothetical protein